MASFLHQFATTGIAAGRRQHAMVFGEVAMEEPPFSEQARARIKAAIRPN